uniref:Essential for reactive oxygen species protein n=1 Tax=Oncorhynchus kisutch TaxID=8019 RepID=A0A8C7KSI2_ONCKI
MGYMQVEGHTTNMLHLKRSPGIRSWSLLIGIASIGLAAAYYSSDSILWKLFYMTGCLFVAMQNMEDGFVAQAFPGSGGAPVSLGAGAGGRGSQGGR